MGSYYVHKDGVVAWAGTCPDGDEELQAPDGYQVGRGEPPQHMIPNNPVAELGYDVKRLKAYPSVNDQLDMLWHAMDDGVLTKVEPFYSQIKAVKEAHPKI